MALAACDAGVNPCHHAQGHLCPAHCDPPSAHQPRTTATTACQYLTHQLTIGGDVNPLFVTIFQALILMTETNV